MSEPGTLLASALVLFDVMVTVLLETSKAATLEWALATLLILISNSLSFFWSASFSYIKLIPKIFNIVLVV